MDNRASESAMTTERRTAHATMTWIWGISLVMGWTVAFLAAFGIASTLGSAGVWPAGEAVARLDLAALGITMAVLGTVVVLASCRLVFGCWPTVRVWHIAVLLVGVGLAVAVELALHEWARVHIGQYEFDHMGPTAFLASLVLFVAAASFATLIAPVDAEWPPLLAAGLATLLIVVVLVGNVPGLNDGIEPESWALAVLIGISAAYSLGCVVLGARRVGRRRSSPR